MADENDLVDDDLDQDLPEDKEKEGPKLGEQEDGSFVVAVDDDKDEPKEDDKPKAEDKEADGEEGETDDERAAIRERRRQEKLDRRNRAKEREDRLKREVEQERSARRQLEERLSVIERRSTGAEMAQLDQAAQQMAQVYQQQKARLAEAQTQGDGVAVANATEQMLLAQQRYQQIQGIKQAYQQRANQPAPLDPTVVNHAQKFMDRHKWYRADGNDDDSSIVRTIDNKLAAEGWNPATPQYWEELQSRVEKYLPHRKNRGSVANNSDEQQGSQRRPNSPVGGSGREGNASAAPKGSFRLSPERISAMKDAGLWDDPKKREAAIRSYRDYDRQHKGR